jgi:phospholipid/cholesterol/gamma-HCH transport system ATP-binding protein
MIEFRGLKKSFHGKVILDGVDLTIGRGEIHFVIGTSGAGKSVLLKHLVGLLEPDAGSVHLDGVDITGFTEREFYAVRKKCALVFQHATLFDSMSCIDNVALPLRKHFKMTDPEAQKRARELLDEVEMAAFASALPARLGDGLRKRVAVARALTLSPEFVLFDEPTTSLDPLSARRVDGLIASLAKQRGVGCLVVSHDLASIFSIAERVTMLYKGQVRASGTPEELLSLSDPIVAQFIHGNPEGPLETT